MSLDSAQNDTINNASLKVQQRLVENYISELELDMVMFPFYYEETGWSLIHDGMVIAFAHMEDLEQRALWRKQVFSDVFRVLQDARINQPEQRNIVKEWHEEIQSWTLEQRLERGKMYPAIGEYVHTAANEVSVWVCNDLLGDTQHLIYPVGASLVVPHYLLMHQIKPNVNEVNGMYRRQLQKILDSAMNNGDALYWNEQGRKSWMKAWEEKWKISD